MKVVFDRMEELPEEVVKEEQEKQKSCGTQQKYRKAYGKSCKTVSGIKRVDERAKV